MHVLVIDDDKTFCHLLSAHLRRKGYEVSLANDAIQGQRLAQLEQPDLIIVDYNMPGASGVVVLERLRGMAATASIPAIILSGSLSDEITAQAAVVGAHRVLSKLTLTEDSLVEAVESALERANDTDSEAQTLFPGMLG